MAERFVTVAQSGGDYTSLAAAEAGEQADLVAAGDHLVIEIQGDWSGVTDETALFSGYTTDAASYIEIRADAANRYDGTWSTGKYIVSSATNGNIRFADEYVHLRGIQVEPVSSAGYGIGAIGGGSNCFAYDCAVKGAGSGTACYGIISTGGLTLRNCVAFGGPRGFYANGSGTMNSYNCTAYGHTQGFDRDSGTHVARNCLSQNNTTDFEGTFDASSNYNCDEDGTATGANSFTDTASFTDAANGDLHLTAALSQQGEDLTSLGVTTDFEGDARSNWDVGADERTAVAPSTFVPRRALMGVGF